MQSVLEVLPLFRVRAHLHGHRRGAAAMSIPLRRGEVRLRGSHEQVRVPVAGRSRLRSVPGRRTVRRGEEQDGGEDRRTIKTVRTDYTESVRLERKQRRGPT